MTAKVDLPFGTVLCEVGDLSASPLFLREVDMRRVVPDQPEQAAVQQLQSTKSTLITKEGKLSFHAVSSLFILSLLGEGEESGASGMGNLTTYSAWTDIMPHFVRHPWLWNRDALETLKGTSIHATGVENQARLAREVDELQSILGIAMDSTAWAWADSVKSGRFFPIDQKTREFALSPLKELFTYGADANVVIDEDEEGSLRLVVVADEIAAGQPLILNDGNMSSADLLQAYGFALANNRANDISVGVALDRDDRLFGAKRDLLESAGLGSSGQVVVRCNATHILPTELLTALRIYHLTVYDWEERNAVLENKPVSLQNERDALTSLAQYAEASLEGFGGSERGDKERLASADGAADTETRIGLSIRLSERRLFKRLFEQCARGLEWVQSKWDNRGVDYVDMDTGKVMI